MTEIDVFPIRGQSNALQGLPYNSAWPLPQKTKEFWQGNVQDLQTAGPWNFFAASWVAATGRWICFVNSAVGGSSMYGPINPQNWDAGGTLHSTAWSNEATAMSQLTTAGFTPVLRGILHLQGEADAIGINRGQEVQSDYISSLAAYLARDRSHYGSTIQHFFVKTGTAIPGLLNATDANDAGFALIRAAQEAAVDNFMKIAHREAVDYPSLGWVTDGIHYTIEGQRDYAESAASTILSGAWTKPSPCGFMATKDGTDQTGIIPLTPTKINFPAEMFDRGFAYDAVNSLWKPRRGLVKLEATLSYIAGFNPGTPVGVMLYKNGSMLHENLFSVASPLAAPISVADYANGTDTYEIYAFCGGTDQKTVRGLPPYTRFSGAVL